MSADEEVAELEADILKRSRGPGQHLDDEDLINTLASRKGLIMIGKRMEAAVVTKRNRRGRGVSDGLLAGSIGDRIADMARSTRCLSSAERGVPWHLHRRGGGW